MLKVKQFICSALLVVVSAAPALAGTKDATNLKVPAQTTAEPATPPAASPNINSAGGNGNITALLGVLVMKGVLEPGEANSIRNAAPEAEFQLLVEALARKGLMSAADLSAVNAPRPPVNAAVAAAVPVAASPAQGTTPKETKPAGPAVVPAIAPIRVLPIDPPVKDGLKAAFMLGPVKMTPYGFLKATAVYDTSNPNGDDMPFPGLFLSSTSILNTGPTKNPEFHLKARSARVGANFEFPDIASKLTLTGRIEGDYEGNFSEVDNRDVSSIRSSMFSFRQAWARLDYAAGEKTDIYFEGGQDWTLFGWLQRAAESSGDHGAGVLVRRHL